MFLDADSHFIDAGDVGEGDARRLLHEHLGVALADGHESEYAAGTIFALAAVIIALGATYWLVRDWDTR